MENLQEASNPSEGKSDVGAFLEIHLGSLLMEPRVKSSWNERMKLVSVNID